MRILKNTLVLLFLLLLIFIGHTLLSTGFFRDIKPQFDGKILKKIAIIGAEDITISQIDSFALISSTNRNVYPPDAEEKGGLYLIDLKANDFIPIPLTNVFNQPFAPHGISFFKTDSTYQVMAINHTSNGHSIEVFELVGKKMNHIKTLRHPSMIQPNDLVMVDKDRFYFTNDHKYTEGFGKLVEEYTGLAISNVVYFDGNDYREVADGIAYANGINYDQKRNLLFVASPRGFLVKVYLVKQDGSLTHIENIPCGTGVDNIEFDQEGNLWIGAHPSLLRFSAYAKGKYETSPSELIKIDYRKRGDYSIEKVYVEDGQEMSGSTVAATFGNLIFAGNVMDEEFLILERNVVHNSN
jgi:arylesterase/paraoxonase